MAMRFLIPRTRALPSDTESACPLQRLRAARGGGAAGARWEGSRVHQGPHVAGPVYGETDSERSNYSLGAC